MFYKLRSGGKPKIPKGLSGFNSDSNVVNTVCNILRCLHDLFPVFDQHKLCEHSQKISTGYSCMFCLVRSLVYRTSSGKTQNKVKPYEILSQLNHFKAIEMFDWNENVDLKSMYIAVMNLMER